MLALSSVALVACGEEELKEFENIVFENVTVQYDGESHSLAVSGAPDFATVSYNQNGFVREGTYTIIAYVMADGYRTLSKTATLTITPPDSSVSELSDFRFTYNGEGYVVVGYDGDSSNVVIPSTYNGKPVVAIGDAYNYGVFYNKPFITSISVPNSVTDVYYANFASCKNLVYNEYKGGYYLGTKDSQYNVLVKTNLDTFAGEIHSTVKAIQEISYGAQQGGATLKIVIPEGVVYMPREICQRDDYDEDVLATVLLPNSMKVDKIDVITDCDPIILFKDDCKLERLTRESLFNLMRCSYMELVLPKSVKYIEDNVFRYNNDGIIHIYYGGTEEDFKKIEIAEGNDQLLMGSCRVFCYSEVKPADDGKLYWRYVDGVPTSWTLIDEVPGSGGAGSSGSC